MQKIDVRIRQVSQTLDELDRQEDQLATGIHGLKLLMQGPKDIRVALVDGVFIDAVTSKTSTAFLSVGNGVVVEKTCDEVVKTLTQQLNRVRAYQQRCIAELEGLSQEVDDVQISQGKTQAGN